MIPVFFSAFGEDLPAYFTMLMAAFAACTWFAVRWSKRLGRDHEVMIDLSLFSLITGVAGARLAHVLFDGFLMDYVHLCTDFTLVDWHIPRAECEAEWVQGVWDEAAGVCHPAEQDCWAIFRFWQGGLTWYGGLLGGAGYAMYFLRKEGFPRLEALDMGGNVLPLGLFFGRLGCFFGGCCFGLPTDSPFGMSFPEWSPASETQWRLGLLESAAHRSLPVIPTQLLEAGGSLLISFFVIGWLHPRKRFTGEVFCVSIALYAILRFFLEFLRADDRGDYGLMTSQWISLGLLVAVGVAWSRMKAYAEARRAVLRSGSARAKLAAAPA